MNDHPKWKDKVAVHTSSYGFSWKVAGATAIVEVQRLFSMRGRAVVVVGAVNGSEVNPGVQVVVSPGGRSVRVWDVKTGRELK